jgi:hypothetical protein
MMIPEAETHTFLSMMLPLYHIMNRMKTQLQHFYLTFDTEKPPGRSSGRRSRGKTTSTGCRLPYRLRMNW